jgi:hypothetical protein
MCTDMGFKPNDSTIQTLAGRLAIPNWLVSANNLIETFAIVSKFCLGPKASTSLGSYKIARYQSTTENILVFVYQGTDGDIYTFFGTSVRLPHNVTFDDLCWVANVALASIMSTGKWPGFSINRAERPGADGATQSHFNNQLATPVSSSRPIPVRLSEIGGPQVHPSHAG